MASGKGLRLPGTEFESTGNRARSVAAGGPNVGGFKNTTATDIGLGAAVALDAVQKINIERDSVMSVKAETEGVIAAEKAMSELDPMALDYKDKVTQIWGDAGKNALATSGITTSEVKNDLERRFMRHSASAELIGIKLRKDAVSRESLLTAKDAADAVGAKIRNDPAGANNYLAEHQADMERLKVGMDPNQLREFSRTAADKFASDQVIGYAEKGNFSAARNALKSQAPHLSTEKTTGLSSYIDSKETKARVDGDRATANSANLLQARMFDWAHGLGPAVSREEIDARFKGTQQYASMVSVFGAATEKLKAKNDQEFDKILTNHAIDISARISDAQAGKGPMPSREEIDALKTFRQYDDLVKQHNATEIAQRKIEVKTEAAVSAVSTGTAKNQEQADLGIKALLGNVPIGKIAVEGTPEQRAVAIQAMAKIAGTTGFLYGEFKDLLENSDKTTDKSRVGQVAFAAEAADDLENLAPRSLENANLAKVGTLAIVRAEGKRILEENRGTMTKAQAYKQAAETYMNKGSLTIQEEKDRADIGKKVIDKIDFKSLTDQTFSTGVERNVPFVTMPGQDTAMQGNYRRLVEEAWSRTGNEELSVAIAKKQMQSMYGVTQVGAVTKAVPALDGPPEAAALNPVPFDPAGARPQMVFRPIEKYLPATMRSLPPADQALVLQNQIEKGIEKSGVVMVKNPNVPGLASYRLVADGQTEQDLREGRAPSYLTQVLRKDGEGQYETVPGLPRFRPPTDDEVRLDPTFQSLDAARIAKQMQAREEVLTNQTEIRTRKERTASGERPSQMPKPLVPYLPPQEPRAPKPPPEDKSGESAIRKRQREYLEGKK